MKIDKPGKPFPASLAGGGAHAAAKKRLGSQPDMQQPANTSVSLGSTAAQLRGIENSMASAPVVDASKVAEIRQAIAEGRFKVNAEAVAGRLLETVRGLISNKA